MEFYPEGHLIETSKNLLKTSSLFYLSEAEKSGEILEGRAIVCDSAHKRVVELGNKIRGMIFRNECALVIESGEKRDITLITRVSTPVCFVVTGFDPTNDPGIPILSTSEAEKR